MDNTRTRTIPLSRQPSASQGSAAREAARWSRAHVPDPLETHLSWVWALGTAAGLAMVGLLAHTELSSAQVPSAQLTLSAEDVPLADGPV
ncbi:hypothetical protein OG306_17955 [Streptomyces sp. NBC_01241]|uniref:hypothetical protein n=1 Tax=Streptomyces sp. NBC_01241 TaxID=2903794 RepID=UPI00352C4E18|nr:hypothetical protein OG306_17955 [Streptomyces sp. NBC_01241]